MATNTTTSTTSSRCSSPLTRLSPTPPLSVGSASTPLTSSQSSYSSMIEPPPEEVVEGEIFYITRIIARRTPSYPFGPASTSLAVEPTYLVRWWGYGPQDDTWEPSSSLRLTISQMIDTFDSQEHPFTILDLSVDPNSKKTYRVRYGWSSRREGCSPHAEVLWQTPEEMGMMGISAEALEVAEIAWKTGIQPNPSIPVMIKKMDIQPKKRGAKQEGRKGYKLLRVLDEMAGSRRSGAKCLFEYKVGRKKPQQQWFVRYYANSLFGTEVVQQQREKYHSNTIGDLVEVKDVVSVQDNVENEYESERKRNIMENQELMRNLGLLV